MSGVGTLPFQGPQALDTSQRLANIERNTSDLLRWVKILVASVLLLVVVTVVLFV